VGARAKNTIVNRAWMLFPGQAGGASRQVGLIPSERDKHGWMVTPGQAVRVFTCVACG